MDKTDSKIVKNSKKNSKKLKKVDEIFCSEARVARRRTKNLRGYCCPRRLKCFAFQKIAWIALWHEWNCTLDKAISEVSQS